MDGSTLPARPAAQQEAARQAGDPKHPGGERRGTSSGPALVKDPPVEGMGAPDMAAALPEEGMGAEAAARREPNEDLIREALQGRGKRYVWGGASRSGWEC